MTFDLDELTTALTRQQIEASIYEVLGHIGVNTTVWKPGAVVRTMIVAASIVLAGFSQLVAAIARSGFLELADGPWLTLVAKYVYGVDRHEATFAAGELTLVNSGGGIFELDPEDLVVANPSTGRTYRNTEAVELGAGETLTIQIRATEAGSASSAVPGAITSIETPPMLGVTCSNALAIVGDDEEKDPALRTRCYEKLGALSPFGPGDAYAFAARGARRSDGTLVGVTRVRTVRAPGGHVTTYVASTTGGIDGDPDDLETDLGLVNEEIQTKAGPLAVTAWTQSATPVAIAVTYEVWAYNTSGLTDAQFLTAIADRLATFMASQPIGGNVIGLEPGKVFHTAITTAIGSTRPEIFRVAVTSPADDTDVELSIGEVPVLGTVVGVVHQVPPSEGF